MRMVAGTFTRLGQVVAELPFCNEVLSSQRSESVVAKPNRTQVCSGAERRHNRRDLFLTWASVRIHALSEL
jgi:hypothetical protein